MLEVKMNKPTAANEVVSWSIEDSVAVVCIDSPPVNALSANVRDGLDAAFKSVIAEKEATSIVLICAGKTFIAGADISEFGKPPKGVPLHDVLALIENSPKPVVSAIHGNCLGGGLEVALCTHARVAEESAKLGLPEVKLGLLPGGGGPQRLPRLVKIEDALEVVVTGKHYPAAKANAMGFVDEVAKQGELQSTAIAHAKKLAAAPEAPQRVQDRTGVIEESRKNLNAIEDWVKANGKFFRGPKAPSYCVRVVEFAFKGIPFDQALEQEKELFMELMNDSESQAQRYYFFAEREAGKIPDIPKDTAIRDVKKVGIVGAGLMGSGIATCFVTAGYEVVVNEMKQEALDRGLGNIHKNIEGAVARGKMKPAMAEAGLAKLSGSVDMADLADCDLVIEAVFERMDIKKDVFQKLDEVCKPGAILASNTSALDLNEIAEVTKRPGDVIGLHFFSPANIMRLLEIVRGAKTEKDVLATTLKIGKRIGKVSVVSGVCPGFIGNRILFPRQIQAEAMLNEGAMPWAIDKTLLDFGFPMGPFGMADLAGVDLGWVKEESSSSNIREILNENGRHGQKTKAGFYDYDDKRRPTPSPVTEQLIKDFAAKSGVEARDISAEEMFDRCVLPMINEGAKILEEGIAVRASDIDVVWVNGYGWPIHKGGPMWYGDFLGTEEVLKRLKALQTAHGDAFKPAVLLEKLAVEGKKFADFKTA
jgi:3-hydroxyacyl-CoA dehydrogenase